jgi:hypothetical protein
MKVTLEAGRANKILKLLIEHASLPGQDSWEPWELIEQLRAALKKPVACQNCKHWTRSVVNNNGFWWDAKTEPITNGKCDSPKFVYDSQGTPIDGLAYWDSEDYSAGFDTGEWFGCVHFEPNDEGA